MKIGIVSRFDIQEALDLTKEILNKLPDEDIILAPGAARELGKEGTPVEEMDVDSLVTMGGDGTVLYTLQKLPDTPILGVDMGGRGFLADVNPDEAPEAIKKLRNGDLKLVEKEKLAVEISGERMGDALNEGVIRSSEPSRTLSFRALVNGEEVEENKGDGLIVATPTGSTAYAMSAGGPVIDPRVSAYVAVPLSTHRPRTMPFIFPTSSELKVEFLESDRKADVAVDGQITEKASQGDTITFKKSDNTAKFYQWKSKFYEKVREKL